MQACSHRARALRQVVAVVPLCVLFLAGPADAEPNVNDRALATALFNDGRALMSEGRAAEACPKLGTSPSRRRRSSTALCHEQEGLIARSWSEFQEAMGLARRDGRSDREQAAESHVLALEPRLSRLTIVVPESARIEGLRIERDGRELGQASWSTAMPVDGGEHVVRAIAPGGSRLRRPSSLETSPTPGPSKSRLSLPRRLRPLLGCLCPPAPPQPRARAALTEGDRGGRSPGRSARRVSSSGERPDISACKLSASTPTATLVAPTITAPRPRSKPTTSRDERRIPRRFSRSPGLPPSRRASTSY